MTKVNFTDIESVATLIAIEARDMGKYTNDLNLEERSALGAMIYAFYQLILGHELNPQVKELVDEFTDIQVSVENQLLREKV